MTRVFYRPNQFATVAAYDPFRAFMREVFDGVSATHNGAHALRLDVQEAAHEYTVVAELPGIAKENINIEINGTDVKIEAETKPEDTFKRAYARTFSLPAEIDDEKAAAQFENGLLRLTLPKKSANAARKLLVA